MADTDRESASGRWSHGTSINLKEKLAESNETKGKLEASQLSTPRHPGPTTSPRPNQQPPCQMGSSSVPPTWLRHHHLPSHSRFSPPSPPLPPPPPPPFLYASATHTHEAGRAKTRRAPPNPSHRSPHAMSAAAAAASLVASTSLSVPDHLRLRRFRLHLRSPPAQQQLNRFHRRSRGRTVRAVLEDRAPPPPPAEEDAKRYGLNGNGSGLGYDDAVVEAYLGSNGNGNGSAAARGSGNGAAVKGETGSSVALVAASPVEKETRRKERVEEIGREDAWFKQSSGQGPLPEVSFVCL